MAEIPDASARRPQKRHASPNTGTHSRAVVGLIDASSGKGPWFGPKVFVERSSERASCQLVSSEKNASSAFTRHAAIASWFSVDKSVERS